MKRVHVLEFEDLPWFPTWLRTSLTNNLVVFARLLGVNEVLERLIAGALEKHQTSKIVDLGSGSGGPLPAIHQKLTHQKGFEHIQLGLSDKYPNPNAINAFNGPSHTGVRYRESPVDATQLETAGPGLKTMVDGVSITCGRRKPERSGIRGQTSTTAFDLRNGRAHHLAFPLVVVGSAARTFICFCHGSDHVRIGSSRELETSLFHLRRSVDSNIFCMGRTSFYREDVHRRRSRRVTHGVRPSRVHVDPGDRKNEARSKTGNLFTGASEVSSSAKAPALIQSPK